MHGVSDPLVRVKDHTGKEILKTEAVKNNLDPTWSAAKGSVRMKAVEGDATGKVVFTVENDNLTGNDFLGRASMDIQDILKQGIGIHDVTLPLKPRDGEKDKVVVQAASLGTINISFTII